MKSKVPKSSSGSRLLERAWRRAIGSLSHVISRPTFESFIRPIRPLQIEGSVVRLAADSAFAQEWLEKRYADTISHALERVLARPIVVRFEVAENSAEPLPEESGRLELEQPPAPAFARSTTPGPDWLAPLVLNDTYTFDRFVVGSTNRLAQASALAAAESPGAAFNPLYLYGPSGVGKTHLLHAVARRLREKSGVAAQIGFLDGESFAYHFLAGDAGKGGSIAGTNPEKLDLWLVDDVQYLATAAGAQEEFEHTFNTLLRQGKQIVLTSDRNPLKLEGIDARMRSRFASGLVADIGSPDLETRMGVLETVSREKGWSVPSDVIYYLANGIRTDLRALEGSLNRVVAYSWTMGMPVSVDLAQNILADFVVERPLPGAIRKGVPVDAIMAAVAQRYGLTTRDICSERRDKVASSARQVAMFITRKLTDLSLAQIGRQIGDRDHATVLRAVSRVEEALKGDPALRALVSGVVEQLGR